MYLQSNLTKKYIVGFLIAVIFLQALLTPLAVSAQSSGSDNSTAVFATIGALAAGVAAFCIAQSTEVGASFLAEVKVGKIFQCGITNPPGVHLLSSDGLKKWIFDPAARIVIRSLLHATTQQIVSWIQGGGGSNVGFVKNFEQTLRREADLAGGEFLNNLSGFNLCGNIGAFLRISLQAPGLRQRLGCTLSDIARNVNSFYSNFQNGGWQTFLQISFEPQDSAAGAFLIAAEAKFEAERLARERVEKPASWGRGFRGFEVPKEVCEVHEGPIDIGNLEGAQNLNIINLENPEAAIGATTQTDLDNAKFSVGRSKICRTEYEIKTPGSLISDTLTKATGSGIDFAVHAKEFDEAIATIINALLVRLITASQSGGDGIFDENVSGVSLGSENSGAFLGRVDESITLAELILSASDKKLADLYGTLFKLEATSSATSTEEIKAVKEKIAKVHKNKTSATEIKNNLISAKQLLLGGSELPDITNNLPQISSTLASLAQDSEISVSAPLSSGAPRNDTIRTVQTTIGAITSTTDLIDTVVKELVLVALTAASASQKSIAESHKEILLNHAKGLSDMKTALQTNLGKLQTPSDNRDTDRVIGDSTSLISEASRKLNDANTAIQTAVQAVQR